jgi:hypothetical protein
MDVSQAMSVGRWVSVSDWNQVCVELMNAVQVVDLEVALMNHISNGGVKAVRKALVRCELLVIVNGSAINVEDWLSRLAIDHPNPMKPCKVLVFHGLGNRVPLFGVDGKDSLQQV